MNRDLEVRFNALTDLEAAKALASQPSSHFKSPFILTKDGYFKTINSVVLLTTGVDFIAKLFQPTMFGGEKPKRGFFVGGAKIQSGGVYNSELFYLNKDKSFFLYCYLRDFHPEIFKYAYMMAPESISFSLEKDYDIGYYYDGADFIVDRPLSDERINEVNEITARCIVLAKSFTDEFQILLTPELGHFLEIFPSTNTIPIEQIHRAIELYELYYSLRISKSYSGGEVTEDELRAEVSRIYSIIDEIDSYMNVQQNVINTNIEGPLEPPPVVIRKKPLGIYKTFKQKRQRTPFLKTLPRPKKTTPAAVSLAPQKYYYGGKYRKTRKHRK
jgi:hypothetical protein